MGSIESDSLDEFAKNDEPIITSSFYFGRKTIVECIRTHVHPKEIANLIMGYCDSLDTIKKTNQVDKQPINWSDHLLFHSENGTMVYVKSRCFIPVCIGGRHKLAIPFTYYFLGNAVNENSITMYIENKQVIENIKGLNMYLSKQFPLLQRPNVQYFETAMCLTVEITKTARDTLEKSTMGIDVYFLIDINVCVYVNFKKQLTSYVTYHCSFLK